MGEPRVGTSTLLDDLVRRSEGFRLLSSEAFEGEVDPDASLAGWGASMDVVRSILDALGADQPVLLQRNDLRWADPELARALVALQDGDPAVTQRPHSEGT